MVTLCPECNGVLEEQYQEIRHPSYVIEVLVKETCPACGFVRVPAPCKHQYMSAVPYPRYTLFKCKNCDYEYVRHHDQTNITDF